MIKISGPYCDICETPILLSDTYCFGIPGLKNELHSCEGCKEYFGPGKTIMDWPDCEVKRQIIKLAEVDKDRING